MSSPATVSEWKHPFDSYRQERRWTTICALLCALILHLGVYVALPDELLRAPAVDLNENTTLEVELLQPEALTPEQLKFVEVNPNAPENAPDREDQYSFKSQQAASENVSDRPLEAPEVDGETDSQKILQGAVEVAPPLPPGVYSPEAQQGQGEGTEGGTLGAQSPTPVAPAQPLPTPAFLQQEALTETGPGSRLVEPGESLEFAENPTPDAPVQLYQPQQNPVPEVQQGNGNGGQPEARPMPRARPRLDPELIRGPLMQSRGTTRLRGALAIDATFSEFGEYQQQFYAALQAGWYQEIEFYQPIDTAASVQVRFTIQADGVVRDVEVIHSTASQIATIICESAIIKRSPYRPWTKEMVRVFGTERTLNVSFHYR
ncbi:MAG TPA: hypothetical protein DCX06_09785 [Opitutae bacterium]|nr:hypothetical protein [Opitutae bacterium]